MKITRDEITQLAGKWTSGMSDPQIKNYVMRSHVTNDRQIKQALLEIETRGHTLKKNRVELKRFQLKLQDIEEQFENCTDEKERRILELDVEDARLDVDLLHKRIKGLERELDSFYDFIENLDISKEELDKHVDYDEEEERKYWIARMGKQTALDMLCNGRVGIGNMDSIAMMNEEDQAAILQVAAQYSGMLNVSIGKMQQQLIPYLQELEKLPGSVIPTFHGIEDNLEIPLLQKLKDVKGELNAAKENIQSSDKS